MAVQLKIYQTLPKTLYASMVSVRAKTNSASFSHEDFFNVDEFKTAKNLNSV